MFGIHIRRKYRALCDTLLGKIEAHEAMHHVDRQTEAKKVAERCRIREKRHTPFDFRDVAEVFVEDYPPDFAVAMLANMDQFRDRDGLNPQECIWYAAEYLVDTMPVEVEPFSKSDLSLFAQLVISRTSPPLKTTKALQLGGWPHSDGFVYKGSADQQQAARHKAAKFLALSLFLLREVKAAKKMYQCLSNTKMKPLVDAELRRMDQTVAQYLTK